MRLMRPVAIARKSQKAEEKSSGPVGGGESPSKKQSKGDLDTSGAKGAVSDDSDSAADTKIKARVAESKGEINDGDDLGHKSRK